MISFGLEICYKWILFIEHKIFSFLLGVGSSQFLLAVFKTDICLFQICVVWPRSCRIWLSTHIDRREISLQFPWYLQPFLVTIIDDGSTLSSEFTTFLFEVFWVNTCIINLKVMETCARSKPAKISAVLVHHVLFIAVDYFNSEMGCLAL